MSATDDQQANLLFFPPLLLIIISSREHKCYPKAKAVKKNSVIIDNLLRFDWWPWQLYIIVKRPAERGRNVSTFHFLSHWKFIKKALARRRLSIFILRVAPRSDEYVKRPISLIKDRDSSISGVRFVSHGSSRMQISQARTGRTEWCFELRKTKLQDWNTSGPNRNRWINNQSQSFMSGG